MTKTFPDGSTVELGTGSNHPPGCTGQHAGNYTWFRVDGGQWEIGIGRSMHAHWQALECADSVAEFRQYLEIL